MTYSANPTLEPTDVAELIGKYLHALRLPTTIGYMDCAPENILGDLLRTEIEQLAEIMDSKVAPRFALEWGAKFGIYAAVAVLGSPPQEALDSVSKLFAQIKAEARERIELSLRYQVDETEKAARKTRRARTGRAA